MSGHGTLVERGSKNEVRGVAWVVHGVDSSDMSGFDDRVVTLCNEQHSR